MIRILFMAVFSCALLAGNAASAATITSTFDTDAEGWTGNPGQGLLTYLPNGGNPGGHIRIRDIGAGQNNGFASGALFGAGFSGDLTAFDGGGLSLDMATFARGGGVFGSFGTVFVRGTNGDTGMFDVGAPPASSVWQSYSANFDAASFGKTQVDWLAILADVDFMAIATDAFDGNDTIGIDNVALSISTTTVPLPASALLLLSALGLLTIPRIRKFNQPRTH